MSTQLSLSILDSIPVSTDPQWTDSSSMSRIGTRGKGYKNLLVYYSVDISSDSNRRKKTKAHSPYRFFERSLLSNLGKGK